MTKAEKTAKGLLKYIQTHQTERFWQALLNFFQLPYIAISPRPPKDINPDLEDTYYLD